MLFEDFAEAFAHRTPSLGARLLNRFFGANFSGHKVCGQRLRPFSRWHLTNLDFIQSPFLILALASAGEQENVLKSLIRVGLVNFVSLWTAAECCTLRHPETFRVKRGPFRRLRRMNAARRYVKNPQREIERFTAYFADYNTRPEFLPSGDEEAATVRSPNYFFEVCVLLHRDRELTKSAAWDLSLAEGTWWIAGYAEARGAKIDLVTPEDREHELSEEEFLANERDEALNPGD